MERQILFNLINDQSELDFALENKVRFSKHFQDWLFVIDQVHKQGAVTMEAIEVEALLTNKVLDYDYPKNVNNNHSNRSLIEAHIAQKKKETTLVELQSTARMFAETNDLTLLPKMDKLRERLGSLVKTNNTLTSFGDFSKNVFDKVYRIENGIELEGLYIKKRNGNAQFQNLSDTLGVIEKTDYIVIAGRPSVGKSSFTIALAYRLLKNGYRLLMYSLEMSHEQIIERMATAISGVKTKELESVDRDIRAERLEKYKDAVEKIKQLPIIVPSKRPSNFMEMREQMIKHQDEYDFVMFDHIGLITSFDGRNGDEYETITKVSRGIKELALDLKKPMLVLSQFNRNSSSMALGVDDKYVELFMRDLRSSGALEQDADKVIILYRKPIPQEPKGKNVNKIQELEIKTERDSRLEEEENGLFRIIAKIDKNRTGATKKLHYLFNQSRGIWSEIEENSVIHLNKFGGYEIVGKPKLKQGKFKYVHEEEKQEMPF